MSYYTRHLAKKVNRVVRQVEFIFFQTNFSPFEDC